MTIYEDAGCTIQAPEATVSAFQSTETTRRFYVTAPGAYTLTIIEDATTIATVDITLSSTTSAVCGPYRATAAQPASNVIDGGTP